MSRTIKWSTLSPELRDQIIHEQVMGKVTPGLQSEQSGAISAGGATITYTAQTYNVGGEVPHYTQSLDAAWLVVERVTRPPQSREEAVQGANTQFMLWWIHVDLWACTREAAANEICIAALRACGVEVENGQ